VTHLTIFTDLSNKFKVDWNTLTPIEWPNTPKLAGANESYVKFDITFDMTRNAIIGGGKQFYAGIVNIYAFSPINKGTKESYDLAEQAIILLQNKVIGNVFTYAGGIVPIGKDPQNTNLYAVKAKIPFQSIH